MAWPFFRRRNGYLFGKMKGEPKNGNGKESGHALCSKKGGKGRLDVASNPLGVSHVTMGLSHSYCLGTAAPSKAKRIHTAVGLCNSKGMPTRLARTQDLVRTKPYGRDILTNLATTSGGVLVFLYMLYHGRHNRLAQLPNAFDLKRM